MGPGRNTRLTDSPEFERVYKQGKAYRGKAISVHAFSSGSAGPRLGLSVSKKVGNAVTRNQVKRRLREIFRSHMKDSEALHSKVDFVISARPAASQVTYHELEQEFERALEKLRREV